MLHGIMLSIRIIVTHKAKRKIAQLFEPCCVSPCGPCVAVMTGNATLEQC